MSDTSKTAKIIKRWYYSTAHWQLGDVMVCYITFLWFLLCSMCHSLHVAVNKCINWCFVHLLLILLVFVSSRGENGSVTTCWNVLILWLRSPACFVWDVCHVWYIDGDTFQSSRSLWRDIGRQSRSWYMIRCTILYIRSKLYIIFIVGYIVSR